jgi:hypothetical protein
MYADGTHLPELSATKVEPPKDFPKSLLLDNWLGLLTNTRDFIPQFSLWGGRECRVSLPHGFPRPMPAREEQKAAAVSCVLLLLKPRVLSNGICTAAERGQRLPSFSLFQAKRTPRPAARYFSRILSCSIQHPIQKSCFRLFPFLVMDAAFIAWDVLSAPTRKQALRW